MQWVKGMVSKNRVRETEANVMKCAKEGLQGKVMQWVKGMVSKAAFTLG